MHNIWLGGFDFKRKLFAGCVPRFLTVNYKYSLVTISNEGLAFNRNPQMEAAVETLRFFRRRGVEEAED